MIILVDAEIQPTKHNIPSWRRLLDAQGIGRTGLRAVRAAHTQAASAALRAEAESLSSDVRNKTRCHPQPFNTGLEVLARASRRDKEMEGAQAGRGEAECSLFARDVTSCGGNPEDSAKALLKPIKEFSKTAAVLLHTKNETSEKEIKKKSPIHNSIKHNKVLRNKCNQGGERSLQGNLWEFDERIWRRRRWKANLYSWVGRVKTIVKMRGRV